MLLGEVTLWLPWRRAFLAVLDQEASLSRLSSVAERLIYRGRKAWPKPRHSSRGSRAVAPGALSRFVWSEDLSVPLVCKETSRGTAVVSELPVKVREGRGGMCMKASLDTDSSSRWHSNPKKHLL